MAYNKKQMVSGDKIIEYTNNFEDRVDTAFGSNDTEIEALKQKDIALEEKIDLRKDFIVDYGISGKWYYEKYKNGIVKLWGSDSKTASFTDLSSGWYRTQTLIISIPSDILKSVISVTPPAPVGTNAYGGYLQDISTNAIEYRLYRTAGGLTNVNVETHFTIIGRWK